MEKWTLNDLDANELCRTREGLDYLEAITYLILKTNGRKKNTRFTHSRRTD